MMLQWHMIKDKKYVKTVICTNGIYMHDLRYLNLEAAVEILKQCTRTSSIHESVHYNIL